jgi:CHASE3 domain sensor protein
MHSIDRYEFSVQGHMRLIDARSALNSLQRLVETTDGNPVPAELIRTLAPVVEALRDAADDVIPVNDHDTFMRQACEWNYIALSPRERDMLHEIRCCSDEGKEEIYQMISKTLDCKPMLMPEPR